MKKPLLALGGALLALAVVFLVMERRHKASLRPDFAFETAQVNDVCGFRVSYQGDSVSLIKTGDRWITFPDSFPADGGRIRTALGRLLKIQQREPVSVSTDSARLEEYGLSVAEAKRITWDLPEGKSVTILLGKTSGADFNSMYWKLADKPGVYRTPGNFTYEIPVRPSDWKDRTLFPAFAVRDLK
jgi:hypothetical protein